MVSAHINDLPLNFGVFLKEILRKSLINHTGARSAPGKIGGLVYFLKEMLRKSLINHPGARSAPGKNQGVGAFP